MTDTVEAPPRRRPTLDRHGHWIDDWRPEDPVFWDRVGAPIARRNLIVSVASEHIGFSIWILLLVFVLFMGP